jgi:hypothetical protein
MAARVWAWARHGWRSYERWRRFGWSEGDMGYHPVGEAQTMRMTNEHL